MILFKSRQGLFISVIQVKCITNENQLNVEKK